MTLFIDLSRKLHCPEIESYNEAGQHDTISWRIEKNKQTNNNNNNKDILLS